VEGDVDTEIPHIHRFSTIEEGIYTMTAGYDSHDYSSSFSSTSLDPAAQKIELLIRDAWHVIAEISSCDGVVG
jgi:hypothetical protein